MQENYEQIEALDAIVLAISADTVEESQMTVIEFNLHFPVLSDPTCKVIKAYDVYSPEENGAFPTTFIIDKKGFIKWQSPIGERMYPDVIISELKQIKG